MFANFNVVILYFYVHLYLWVIVRNKMYWGKRFWGRGYFSATSGHITDEVINEYINKHTDAHQPHSISSIRLE
ncbi:transposase [Wolbachia endosymbiont (group B) of Cyclophora punctaria]|uniref:transposase n=1 Tax=Wolbachia endosymbiont (group B) of Cyclophora punctaria TaxID=3066168 RepID=UPI00333E29A9